MKTLNLFPALVICCLSFSCTKELPVNENLPATEDLPRPAPPVVYPGFTVSNHFGLKLYGAIYKEKPYSNLCVSPFSVRTCLSLVANGAAGEDLKEILKALNLSDTSLLALNEDYQNLTNYLIKADPKVTFQAANSFWYQTGLDINYDFKIGISEYYDANVYPVNFQDAGTLDVMNSWVSEKTHGKITEIIKEIPPNTLMNLTNALYFNGEWTHKFDRKLTKPYLFKKVDRTYSEIVVMENNQAYRYYGHPAWQGLEMPYGNGNWAMYVFMPRQTGLLDKLTDWLINNWENVRKEFKSDKSIKIYFPQFTIENNFDIIPQLKDLGINRVFHPGANFSRMMKEPMYLGLVIHKTYIKVNEDGTEAAAITSAWGVGGSPPGLFFDHPFTYVIAEKSTGLILFIGQVMDPSLM